MTGVFTSGMLVGNSLGWIWTVLFFFDGLPYQYSYPVGGIAATPKDAAENVRLQNLPNTAQREFLRDVEINQEKPH